ncbi:MAG TPA: hypothetical protein VJ999_12910 [Candidatus Sulfotelmatobacter sp.]|nr:hypothetical protein [Candidatus Sulfotelmatobacter sp.]
MSNPRNGGFKLDTVIDGSAVKHAAGIAAPLAGGAAALAAAAAVTATATKPGKERWPVKTGTDQDIGQVNTKGVVKTTVEEMCSIPRPSDMNPPTQDFSVYQDTRSEPVETTVWQLDATVTALKLEADGDYHLVLQGETAKTMIGEVPTPKPPFVKATSPFLPYVKKARAAVDAALGQHVKAAQFAQFGKTQLPVGASSQPASLKATSLALPTAGDDGGPQATFEIKIPQRKVTVTGVGFFDRVHGQAGVCLLNGIELHPILDIVFH